MHSRALVFMTALLHFAVSTVEAQQRQIHIPQLDGDWWQIAGNPDLGECSTPRQQPVDFGIWQAADSTWQLWSCIRHTACGKNTRLFYGWEGADLTKPNWKPAGIKMQADTMLGEQSGGLQAPYVMAIDQVYYMFYGDWNRICLAKSFDGKHFSRVLNGRGQPDLFTEHAFEPCGNNRARDPMVMKRGNTYYCYYTSHISTHGEDGGAFCRTSLNLRDWSESVMVSHTAPIMGNSPRYSDECPFVVYREEDDLYYYFITQLYGKNSQTTVYASPNPMYFGIDDDTYKVCTLPVAAPELIKFRGQWYIASTMPEYEGIYMCKLKWVMP